MSGGQDPVAWLRRTVEAERAAARDLTESEAAAPHWHEMTSGVLVTGPSTFDDTDDTWDGVHAIGDSRLTRFIADHDPQSVIARCEAELAILGLYEEQAAKVSENAMEEDRAWVLAPVIALLASGYRYREGYREEDWK